MDEMADDGREGLRERKKARTRESIEKAALRLALKRGYDGMTVDDICRMAEISRMTFFNYFPSKLSAIIGCSVRYPSAEQILEALDTDPYDNYLDVLVGLSQVSAPSTDEVRALRREAFEKMPQLFAQGRREEVEMRGAIDVALSEYLPEHPRRRLMPDVPVEQEVFLAMHVCRAILHIDAGLRLCEAPETDDPRKVRLMLARYLAGEDANIADIVERSAANPDDPKRLR